MIARCKTVVVSPKGFWDIPLLHLSHFSYLIFPISFLLSHFYLSPNVCLTSNDCSLENSCGQSQRFLGHPFTSPIAFLLSHFSYLISPISFLPLYTCHTPHTHTPQGDVEMQSVHEPDDASEVRSALHAGGRWCELVGCMIARGFT